MTSAWHEQQEKKMRHQWDVQLALEGEETKRTDNNVRLEKKGKRQEKSNECCVVVTERVMFGQKSEKLRGIEFNMGN